VKRSAMSDNVKPDTNASHDRALRILKRRNGKWSEVWLRDGRRVRVLNIAWGYDLSDPVAHVITNISPSLAGADLPVDFFRTDEVVRSPRTALSGSTPTRMDDGQFQTASADDRPARFQPYEVLESGGDGTLSFTHIRVVHSTSRARRTRTHSQCSRARPPIASKN
jgi:hypothetical protein